MAEGPAASPPAALDAALLSGMRVVEAAAFVAAPLGGMTLAQMGADVIRIDPLAGGLDHHRWPVTRDDVSLFWCGLNKSKRSVTLDLASPAGRELAMALITAPGDDAGMLLTNFPPRGWLAHDALTARRADLIQVTLTGDRHGGSAVDYTINPRLGIPFVTGPAGAVEPVNHVLPAWDLISGQMIAVGLLAAERHRRRTGSGQHVRLALEDVGLAVMSHLGFIAEAAQAQAGRGVPRARHGNELFGAFGRDFACADGARLMVVGLTGRQWAALVAACDLAVAVERIEREHALDLSREGDRFVAREAIARRVGDWMAGRSSSDVAATFDRHGVCWGRYQTIGELVAHDPSCSIANPLFTNVEQAGVGPLLAAGVPLEFSAAPRRPATGAPRLGEHTERVLFELLGTTQGEYGVLLERGVVGGATVPRPRAVTGEFGGGRDG